MMTISEREQTILAHMPQVEMLARRFCRRCPQVELDDLISVGTVGLIQAVDRFDAARNFKVKTFVEYRIKGAFLDYLRQIDPLPRNVHQFQKRRDAVIESFERSGFGPSSDEVASALGVSRSKYVSLCRMITAANLAPLDLVEI